MGNIGIPQLWARGQEPHMDAQRIGSQYWRKVVSIRPRSLYAYWPIWEPSGTDVQDYSGNGDRATSTGLGVRNPGPDGVHQAPAFNATPSYINLLSAEFTAHFNGLEGTYLGWAKAASVGQWTDANIRSLFHVTSDGNNYLRIYKDSLDFNFVILGRFGGAFSFITWTDLNPGVSWFMYGVTWSNVTGELKAYYQGLQKEAAAAIGAAYVGAPTIALLGAHNAGATYPWLGYLAHVALWNVPLSAAEIKHLSEV